MRDIVIAGAGAMGCLFAARLAQGGANVVLADVDDARLAALARDGVTLADDDGERAVPIRACRAADVAGPVDLVMLFTKGQHSAAAIGSVAHLAGPGVSVLTLQNGVGNAEIVAGVFAPDSIVLGVTDFPADLEGPTRVSSHGRGHVWVGGFSPGPHAGAQAVAALFNRAGLETAVDDDVRIAVWEKVAFNAALNGMATVTGLTVGGMATPPGRRIAAAVVGEVVQTAAAQGVVLDRARVTAKIDFALTHHGPHKASMLQDRLAGRRTEIESIHGAIVRAAQAAGVATPVTATLADLVRMIEDPT